MSYEQLANGSLTSESVAGGDTTTYVYNLQNRLSSVTAGTNPAVVYKYSTSGIRVSKKIGSSAPADYLIDDYNPTGFAQVLKDETSVYIIGSDIIAQDTSGTIAYFIYDGHGSVRYLADNTGAIISGQDFDYDAYGNRIDASTAQTNLLYTGEWWDSHIKGYNLRARDYRPDIGIFMTLDPYSGNNTDPISLHKYLYTHANPINNLDPTGEFVDFSALGQSLTNAINSSLQRAETFYQTRALPWAYFQAHRLQMFALRAWVLANKVLFWATVADAGLSFLDNAATAWLENTQSVPASPVDRGNMLHDLAGGNLGRTFPKIDNFDFKSGIATSIKTHGISSQESLLSAITNDVRALTGIEQTGLKGLSATGERVNIEGWQIQSKNLLVGVPQTQSYMISLQSFRDAIRNIQTQYKTTIEVVPVKGWKK